MSCNPKHIPRIGIFFSKIFLFIFGKFFLVTEDGPPDKIIPFILLKSLNFSSFLGVIINEKTLNSMVDVDPENYRDDKGNMCRYPEHNAKFYNFNESKEDIEIVKIIRSELKEIKGLSNLGKQIEPGKKELQNNFDPKRYVNQRLNGAKALAYYNVMSKLRSSKIALQRLAISKQN